MLSEEKRDAIPYLLTRLRSSYSAEKMMTYPQMFIQAFFVQRRILFPSLTKRPGCQSYCMRCLITTVLRADGPARPPVGVPLGVLLGGPLREAVPRPRVRPTVRQRPPMPDAGGPPWTRNLAPGGGFCTPPTPKGMEPLGGGAFVCV